MGGRRQIYLRKVYPFLSKARIEKLKNLCHCKYSDPKEIKCDWVFSQTGKVLLWGDISELIK
jgi:hypothetical protein